MPALAFLVPSKIRNAGLKNGFPGRRVWGGSLIARGVLASGPPGASRLTAQLPPWVQGFRPFFSPVLTLQPDLQP